MSLARASRDNTAKECGHGHTGKESQWDESLVFSVVGRTKEGVHLLIVSEVWER